MTSKQMLTEQQRHEVQGFDPLLDDDIVASMSMADINAVIIEPEFLRLWHQAMQNPQDVAEFKEFVRLYMLERAITGQGEDD